MGNQASYSPLSSEAVWANKYACFILNQPQFFSFSVFKAKIFLSGFQHLISNFNSRKSDRESSKMPTCISLSSSISARFLNWLRRSSNKKSASRRNFTDWDWSVLKKNTNGRSRSTTPEWKSFCKVHTTAYEFPYSMNHSVFLCYFFQVPVL